VWFIKDEGDSEYGPSWRTRRKLIFGAYKLGFAMIIGGGFMFLLDEFGIGVALITGGVSLISIILTAYTASATFEDVKLWKPTERNENE
jgi:hypothetical protein